MHPNSASLRSDKPDIYLNICLGVLLIAFYANLVFKFGSYRTYFYIALVFFVLVVTQRAIRFGISRELLAFSLKKWWPVLLSLFVLIVPSLTLFTEVSHKPSIQHLAYFLPLVAAGLWTLHNTDRHAKQIAIYSILVLAFIAVLANFSSRNGEDTWAGIFSNPHNLAMLCIWVIPFFIHIGSVSTHFWVRLTAFAFVLPSAYLLVISGSRPAWIAIGVGITIAVVAMRGLKGLLKILPAGLVLILALAWLFPVRFADRFYALLANLWQEERVEIWKAGFSMLASNDFTGWLLGHGIGTFRHSFAPDTASLKPLVFPHNFALEVTFDNGLLGSALILFAAVYAVRLLAICRKQAMTGTLQSSAAFLLISLAITHTAFCFLTFSFYSYPFLYWLAPLISVLLYLSGQNEQKSTG